MRRVTPDKSLLARRFGRSLAAYDGAAVVQREMARRLIEALVSCGGTDRFGSVLELGCGSGLLTRALLRACRVRRLALNDLAAACVATAVEARTIGRGAAVRFVHGDMETMALPRSRDLILTSAAVQWAEDPLRLVRRVAGLLRGGGFAAIASFGPGNLREVAGITGVSLHYPALREIGAALSEQCDVLRTRAWRRVLRFASAHEILRHMRATGVNALAARAWTRREIAEFCRVYEARYGGPDGVPLTYSPVLVVARRRSRDSVRGRD
jgi:malonyl-ACP O-methyltransferase BioC